MKPWLIWFVGSLFYLFEVMLRVAPSVMTYELMQSFEVNSTQLGLLTSFYYYPYVALQVICGIIVDYFGTRRVIITSVSLSTLGIVLFGLSKSLWTAQIARLIIGMGASCAFISTLKIASDWFPNRYFARMCGLTNMMGTIGGGLLTIPLAKSVHYFSWSKTCLGLGFVGLAIIALCTLFIEDPKKETDMHDFKTFLGYFINILKNPTMWAMGMVCCIMYLPISGFADLWSVPFVTQALKIPTTLATSVSAQIFIGSSIGSIMVAWIASAMGSYTTPMKIANILLATLFLGLAYFIFPIYLMIPLFFAIGLMGAPQILCFSWFHDYSNNNDYGIRLGFCNALTMLGGIIMQPFLGILLDYYWTGTLTETGTRLYDITAYQHAILIFPIGFIIACVMLYFIRDTYRTE